MRTSTKSTPVKAARTTSPSTKYLELPLPKIRLRESGYAPLLVTLLVIASYLLGMLTTKIQYLEKTGAPTTTAQATGNTQQVAGAQDPQQQAAPEPKKEQPAAGHLPVLGDANAKVTFTEFSDFQCPFCEQFYTQSFGQLKQDYIDTGKVKVVFRHFPLPFHPNAEKAAEASECANEQQAFWQYHDTLFGKQAEWSPLAAADADAKFITYATDLGLNSDQFSTCLTTGKYADKVKEDLDAGTASNVTGTPTLYVNNTPIVGAQPYQNFKDAVEAALK